MKLDQLFRIGIEAGIKADPRDRKRIEKELKKYKDKEKKLEKDEKKFFDKERIWNPYSDSRIINGTGKEEVKRIMVGIDIETPEILLADHLNRNQGEKIDALMLHHPEGRALADLDKVMILQIDLLARVGVPVNQSEGSLRPRMEKIWRAIHADNLFRTERAAALVGLPAFNLHTPTDNLAWQFVEKKICNKEFDSLGEIINALHKIPEYEEYAKKGNPCILANGNKSGRPGKVVATEFTGGTNGPEEFIESQGKAGVGTILTMHTTEKSLEAAKKQHINLVQCSHIASDALGINLMLDIIAKKESKLSTVDVSGFIRIKR